MSPTPRAICNDWTSLLNNAGGLRIHNLSFSYGGARAALEDISFTVNAGQFCALLGPNGAGKSTLFALMTRMFTAPAGTIEIDGHNIARSPRAALAAMGIVYQQSTLDLDLSVWRNMTYFAALHGLSGREATHRIEAALDRLQIRDRAKERARDLNGGHRRRAEIARALIHGPRVLLLDEATVGLDPAARAAITQHVHDLASDGLTVLWATHLADEVRDDDRLLVLHKARLLADGTCRDLRGQTPLTQYFLTQTGGAA